MGVRNFRELVCWQRFLEIARASLDETRNHLIDGRDRGYLANPLYSRLQNLTRAARKSTTNLMLSKKRDAQRLKRSEARAPWNRDRQALYLDKGQ
jgi:hypothetical protein